MFSRWRCPGPDPGRVCFQAEAASPTAPDSGAVGHGPAGFGLDRRHTDPSPPCQFRIAVSGYFLAGDSPVGLASRTSRTVTVGAAPPTNTPAALAKLASTRLHRLPALVGHRHARESQPTHRCRHERLVRPPRAQPLTPPQVATARLRRVPKRVPDPAPGGPRRSRGYNQCPQARTGAQTAPNPLRQSITRHKPRQSRPNSSVGRATLS